MFASLPVSDLLKNPLDYFFDNPAIFVLTVSRYAIAARPGAKTGAGGQTRFCASAPRPRQDVGSGNPSPLIAACLPGVGTPAVSAICRRGFPHACRESGIWRER